MGGSYETHEYTVWHNARFWNVKASGQRLSACNDFALNFLKPKTYIMYQQP